VESTADRDASKYVLGRAERLWDFRTVFAVNDITRILNAIENGQEQAGQELIPLIYDELRTMAARKMANERPGQTLQATALVNEAYLRLIGNDQTWQSRGHFFSAAAEAMRRILVDNARRKKSRKHGGGLAKIELSEVDVAIHADEDHLLLVNEALEKLTEKDPQAAELIKLRFFAGMSNQEAARTMNLAERSATRLWAYARAWLYKEINDSLKP
jgi:RNA polymerase sigma factor (TIGR02999 family)